MGLKYTRSLLSKKTKAELIELAESDGIEYDEGEHRQPGEDDHQDFLMLAENRKR